MVPLLMKSKPPHPASKKEAVFRAAKSVFIRSGFAGASMDEIARTAGATKATVYAHAKSKEELFRFTVREAVKLAAAKIWAPDQAVPKDQALDRFLARFVEISCWQGAVSLQRTVIAAQAEFPDTAELIYTEVFVPARTVLSNYLAGIGVGDAENAAGRLIEAATGARRYRTLLGVQAPLPLTPDPKKLADGALDMAVRDAVKEFCSLQMISEANRTK